MAKGLAIGKFLNNTKQLMVINKILKTLNL
jgi:hypothetical protein